MDPIPKDVLFILDISGSMSGKKIEQQREAMDKILQDLHEGDNFNIMQFSSAAKLWQQSLVPANNENKQKARAYSQAMFANGGELLELLLIGSFLHLFTFVYHIYDTLCVTRNNYIACTVQDDSAILTTTLLINTLIWKTPIYV